MVDFKEATDRIAEACVTHVDVAEAAGVAENTIRRARMAPESKGRLLDDFVLRLIACHHFGKSPRDTSGGNKPRVDVIDKTSRECADYESPPEADPRPAGAGRISRSRGPDR